METSVLVVLQDKGKPKTYEIPIITIKTLTNYMPIIQLPQDQERISIECLRRDLICLI